MDPLGGLGVCGVGVWVAGLGFRAWGSGFRDLGLSLAVYDDSHGNLETAFAGLLQFCGSGIKGLYQAVYVIHCAGFQAFSLNFAQFCSITSILFVGGLIIFHPPNPKPLKPKPQIPKPGNPLKLNPKPLTPKT